MLKYIKNKFINNTIWLLADKCLKMILGFYVITQLSRSLGPENYGILSFSQSIISIFIAITSLGINFLVVEQLINSKNRDDTNIILGSIFIMRLFVGFICFFITIFLNLYFNNSESSEIIIILSIILLFEPLNIIDSFYQSKVKSKYIVICTNLKFIIGSAAKLYAISHNFSLRNIAIIFLFESILQYVLYLLLYKLHGFSFFSWKPSVAKIKKLLHRTWPLALVAIFTNMYNRVDQVMLNSLLDNYSVGIYSAANKINELFFFIPIVVSSSIFPLLVSKQNTSSYIPTLLKVYKINFLISLPVSILLFIFSEFLVLTIYGQQFNEAITILKCLAITIVIKSINLVFVKYLYIEGLEKKYLKMSIIGFLINIVLNFYLIREFGIIGAALATLSSLFITTFLFELFDSKLRKVYYLKIQWLLPINTNEKDE
ncbi:flippase [Halobacteriovorax sp. DA5]|uniref:flippase n=1 Tax=Halobacteriovorax sp. DA5 TaxID=2067553 RepID=UPI000CD1896C|nr:flippase [Halobacteriovorax sp. DA5]POB13202.1 hypothetical protein C0Z22_11860 [Halobacteriovorax sp. DA5]